MKMVRAIIRPEKTKEVRDALEEKGFVADVENRKGSRSEV